MTDRQIPRQCTARDDRVRDDRRRSSGFVSIGSAARTWGRCERRPPGFRTEVAVVLIGQPSWPRRTPRGGLWGKPGDPGTDPAGWSPAAHDGRHGRPP
ncbi:hypothetical protein WR25_12912 [Diploscapter pachys]|uniref:Uncharacterized protein n=1 Tax=Diploscapter pachys TaxID=2018661 RepID=A0A2A2K4I1_9BILA|nr:hypothetical protein WR25_12912 [Diploscapter pachys]